MASFTIELRTLVETFGDEVTSWFTDYDLSDYLNQNQIDVIQNHGWTKEKLANKIIDHYLLREIGFESPAYFAHKAKVFMSEIMEEKLPLIYAKTQIVNPLFDTNITEEFSGKGTATSASNSTNSGDGLTINSNTPQGQINKETILSGEYASSTSANEGTSKSENSGTSDSTNNYVKTIRGNQKKTPVEMIKEWQRDMVAIEKEIIDRAGELFINIYDTGF